MKFGWTIKKSLLTVAAGAGLMLAQITQAAEDAPKINSGNVSFSAGVDWYTHYFFRGMLQENQGLIIQPYGSATFKVYEGDGPINSVSITGGVWESMHSGPTGTKNLNSNPEANAGDPALLFESDFFGGVSVGFLNDFTAGVLYSAYTSPSGQFSTVQDVAFSLAFNDAKCWEGVGLKGFALNPSFQANVETDGQADMGNKIGFGGLTDGDKGVYFQFAIAPSFVIVDSKDYPITLSIPVIVGFGSDYYEVDKNGDGAVDEDSTFGYVDVGLMVSTPISFIPAKFGAWTLKGGVHGIYLGDSNQFLNHGAPIGAGQDGDEFEIIGTVGLSMSY